MPGSSPWRTRVRLLQTELGDFGVRNLINLGAVAGAVLLLAASWAPLQILGAAAAVASFIAIIVRRSRQIFSGPDDALLGFYVTVRALLLISVGAGYLIRSPDSGGWAWVGVGLALMLVLAETLIKGLLGTTRIVVANLPGVPTLPSPPLSAGWVTLANLVLILFGGLCAVLALPGWLLLLAGAATIPLSAIITRYAVRVTVNSRRAEAATRPALERLHPRFVIYYAAVAGVRYQLGMWLPYLERLGQPFVVITRNPVTVPEITELTSAPVLVPRTDRGMSNHLDSMVVDSLRAAFYVQGSPGNGTFQRYPLTHVWLNHGDSDKQANYHPRHATYTKVFVSGQQGIDRYAAHGIDVPRDKFAIVGRPQIEEILVRDEPLPPNAPRTVLYAPTWKGGRPSTNYSSLPVGEQIVRRLLDRGSIVIFRPHPLSYSDRTDTGRIQAIQALLEADRQASGRQHVWGQQAERDWDVPSCFNASDALITDVSSLASDYLASGKPFAMVAITAAGEAFRTEFPMARVAYVIEPDLSTLDEVLDALHGADHLASQRRAYRTYCLGEHLGPDAAREFLRIAGEIVTA
ncbi:MAG TPA: CDP-glycerol glycerophosphotransferase family protein [Microlunatus sp.]